MTMLKESRLLPAAIDAARALTTSENG